MPRKPTRTFHPLDMARSIEAQSSAVAKLLSAVSAMVKVAGDRLPAEVVEMIEREIAQCRAVMWPESK